MAARSEDTWKMTWGGGEGRGWVRGAGQMGRNLNKEHGSFFLSLSISLFRLWKYVNTFTGDLGNTEQSYIQFHCILQLFFK